MASWGDQNRFGIARGWLIASIVSAAAPVASAGEASLEGRHGAGPQTSPLRREAPVFTYRQFTSRLPELPETRGEAEPADEAPVTLPARSASRAVARDRLGLMGRFGEGVDAAAARDGLSGMHAEGAERRAHEPGTTASLGQRPSAPDADGEQGSRPVAAALLGTGRASWYKHPGRTASGAVFDPDALTAAHHTLPFGTKVRVVNRRNGRAVVVEITDRTNERTKAKRNYAIDLSRASARKLGIAGVGLVALYKVD